MRLLPQQGLKEAYGSHSMLTPKGILISLFNSPMILPIAAVVAGRTLVRYGNENSLEKHDGVNAALFAGQENLPLLFA